MNVSFERNPELMNMIESEKTFQNSWFVSSNNWVCLFWVKPVHG